MCRVRANETSCEQGTGECDQQITQRHRGKERQTRQPRHFHYIISYFHPGLNRNKGIFNIVLVSVFVKELFFLTKEFQPIFFLLVSGLLNNLNRCTVHEE